MGEPRTIHQVQSAWEAAEQEAEALRDRLEKLEARYEETIGFLNDLRALLAKQHVHQAKKKVLEHLEELKVAGLFSFKVIEE